MDVAIAVALGAFVGVAGALPPALLFERALRGSERTSLPAGIASILISFLALSAALLAVYLATGGTGFLEFGCAVAASFLLAWAVEAARGWRSANGGMRSEGRSGREQSARQPGD